MSAPDPAVSSFGDVFSAELALIEARRRAGALAPQSLPYRPPNAFQLGLVGLSLSGGGIRSAAINLGLLQATGKRGVLHHVDYLSTVSGGGYIGSCLSSLCSAPWTSVAAGDRFPFWFNGVDENPVIKYLRRNRQYLGVEDGLLRLRTWRAISAYAGGLMVTLATVALMLAIGAGWYLGLYPWGVYVIERAMGIGHAIALADAQLVLSKPSLYAASLFLPSLVLLALWLGSGLAYAAANFSPSLWTLTFRTRLAKAQALLMAGAILLAVSGAMPFMLRGAQAAMETLRPYLTTTALLSSLSLPGILKLSQNLKGAESALRTVQRFLVAIGATVLVLLICFAVLYGVWRWREWAGWIGFAAFWGVLALSLLTDINRCSMFYFYRDRLSDAFVIVRRTPDGPITGNDELPMSSLAYTDRRVPYHLVNTCVNLPGSHAPALRDRRSDFFLLSPLFCGSHATGYRSTAQYENQRVTVASALAVSGAAANPQFGTRSRPALAFLLTMLNARLGVWAENPGVKPAKMLTEFAPHVAWPLYLLCELFSLADESYGLINVSDGGHIENLGVYELLRRRCRVIVASDAGADAGLTFDDLGNLIRKARIDLGVEIVLDLGRLRDKTARVVVGRINYPVSDVEQPDQGWLVYVKSLLLPGDPIDLQQYQRGHPEFPHESTTDQSFDEEQFESYRQLGYEAGRALCHTAAEAGITGMGLDQQIRELAATRKARLTQ